MDEGEGEGVGFSRSLHPTTSDIDTVSLRVTMTASSPPQPSALSTLLSSSGAKTATDALPLEILHNLQYQHNWADLKRDLVFLNGAGSTPTPGLVSLEGLGINPSSRTALSPSSSGTSTPSTPANSVTLVSGLPPRHSYIHPDLQNHLVKHSIADTAIPVQREFVLPLSLGEKWTLAQFCAVFDQLPERDLIVVRGSGPDGRRAGMGSASASASASASSAVGTANGAGAVRLGAYEHRDQKRVLLGMRAKEGAGGDGTVVYYIMQEGEVKPRQNG